MPEVLFMVFLSDSKGAKVCKTHKCKSCRSRQELSNESLSMSLFLNLLFEPDSYSNEYLLAKFGFDTAENEPLKVCQKLAKS